MSGKYIDIVADIGGTNLRIGCLNSAGEITELSHYKCSNYDSLENVLRHFLESLKLPESKLIRMCLAIACPVEHDVVKMTNLPWQFSKAELTKQLNLHQLMVINDYTAIAMSISLLKPHQVIKIGGGNAVANKPIAICGPGTGLGVANLVSHNNEWISLGGEGGHVDFAPVNETEVKILQFLQQKYQRVSAEQLLSGLGIEQLYQAFCSINSVEAKPYVAADITEKAVNEDCPMCELAVAQFCKTLGSFAGNLALTMASFGGVYIAGGIVPRFTDYFAESEFRRRFEEKGRFKDFNRSIPTYVITESQPGILGACAYLRQYNKEDL